MNEIIDNGEELIIVEEEQKAVNKPKFLSTKAGKVVIAASMTVLLAGGIAFGVTRTPAYQNYKNLKGCTIERVDAVPFAKNGSYLTYIKDEKGKDILVCATDTSCDSYLAPDYLERDGFNIVRDSKDLKCYYEKNGVKCLEAKPIVPEGYELVWDNDHGYMLYKEIITTTYTVPEYVVPEGYILREDKNGYYGVKIESDTKQLDKGKTLGQKTN